MAADPPSYFLFGFGGWSGRKGMGFLAGPAGGRLGASACAAWPSILFVRATTCLTGSPLPLLRSSCSASVSRISATSSRDRSNCIVSPPTASPPRPSTPRRPDWLSLLPTFRLRLVRFAWPAPPRLDLRGRGWPREGTDAHAQRGGEGERRHPPGLAVARLQVADAPLGQARPLGQLGLRQAGGGPQLAQPPAEPPRAHGASLARPPPLGLVRAAG